MGTVPAYPAEGLDFRPAQQEERRRIAAAGGFQHGQHPQGFRRPGAEGNGQVIFRGRKEAFLRRGGSDRLFQAFPQQGDPVRFHGEAGGLLVAAEVFQQVRAGAEHPVDIHPGDRPAGADGGIAVYAQGDGGQVEAFAQAACGEADEPGIPVLPGNDDDVGVRQGLQAQLGSRGGGHLTLQGLAGPVGLLQQSGDVFRFRAVRGQEQVDAEFRVSQAAGGVQARREAEGDVVGGDGSVEAGGGDQGFQAWPGRFTDPAEAFTDDDPVLVPQGNDIRHGRQGGKIQALLHACHTLEGLADLERHAGAAQVREGIIPQQRVHDHVRFGNDFRGLVMVGDDHREAELLREGDLLHIGNAAVHGDKDLCLPGDLPHGVRVQAIAFGMAGRDPVGEGSAFLVQDLHEDGSGADAVGVVIAVDEDGVAAGDGAAQQFHGLFHTGQEKGIVQVRKGGVQETLRFLLRCDAPGVQQGAHPVRKAGEGGGPVRTAPDKPRPGHGSASFPNPL